MSYRNPLYAILGLAIVLLILVLFSCSQWDARRSAEAQSKLDRKQAEARSESATEAIETIDTTNDKAAESEDLTARNAKEIRNAQGADERVNPHVARAGLDSLCRRAAYRDSERCKLRDTHSR
ncbi:hypothetical protein WJS89_10645 [Sphingomicrobium sp. XHP0235]|uniref:hypothetical protein n=1 Tax=Sphingomicrobium aquimarinum TaxID=3133971 RepID=UPI0031FF4336